MDREDNIMISAIAHYAYCPRRCALIHMEQEFAENVFTLQGTGLHERADTPLTTWEGDKRVERAVPLWSDRLGLSGRADTVEFLGNGAVRPVEYKRGARAPKEHDDLQLCAQALCLEEMLGIRVERGAVFYHASRRTREVVFDAALRQRTEQTIAAVREHLHTGRMPPPVNDGRCRHCSLNALCLPEALTAAPADDALFQPAELDPEEP